MEYITLTVPGNFATVIPDLRGLRNLTSFRGSTPKNLGGLRLLQGFSKVLLATLETPCRLLGGCGGGVLYLVLFCELIRGPGDSPHQWRDIGIELEHPLDFTFIAPDGEITFDQISIRDDA